MLCKMQLLHFGFLEYFKTIFCVAPSIVFVLIIIFISDCLKKMKSILYKNAKNKLPDAKTN